MRGAIPPLPQHAFMALCSVKKSTGTILPFYLFPFTGNDIGTRVRNCEKKWLEHTRVRPENRVPNILSQYKPKDRRCHGRPT